MDKHHIAGKANSPIVLLVPANDHRARLSEDQKDWPPKVLENPDGDPLLAAAAGLSGFIDTIVYLAEEFVQWVVDLLVWLSAYLVKRFGPKWWLSTEVKGFVSEGRPRAK